MRKFYDDPGAAALLFAAFHLRELARLEFMYDLNSGEGIFLSQLALDLRRLADGAQVQSTATWRALAAQFPRLFSKDGGTLCYARSQLSVQDCSEKR